MNVPLVTMDRSQAREELREVRRALHRRADEEYQAIERGLEQLAEGHPILSLTQALETAGFDEAGRPRLAIARADRRHLHFYWSSPWHGPVQAVFDTRRRRGLESTTLVVSAPVSPPPGVRYVQGYALVPIIPPRVRNAVRCADRDVFILWEVEAWSDRPLDARPDRDPYLLRHLHGDAYAVLAEWDLTELERLVMAGRRQA